MKHVFRAVDRFCIVIFTLYAINGSAQIRMSLRWRNERRVNHAVMFGSVLYSYMSR